MRCKTFVNFREVSNVFLRAPLFFAEIFTEFSRNRGKCKIIAGGQCMLPKFQETFFSPEDRICARFVAKTVINTLPPLKERAQSTICASVCSAAHRTLVHRSSKSPTTAAIAGAFPFSAICAKALTAAPRTHLSES